MLSCVAEVHSSARVSRRSGVQTPISVVAVPPRQRPIRVGLLGLGQVGQAVARLARRLDGQTRSVPRFRIAGALVRDVARARACHPNIRLTDSPAAFLRGHYDVVIEALGGLEPAHALVTRLLGCGVPVVTANKTLIAASGPELRALAAARGASLRYEASTMAGVPFLGALAERPLVSTVDRFVAILNGTSNFITSTLEHEGGAFAEALAAAHRRGLTEPDPSRDVDGDDAADKLAVLTTLIGWGRLDRAGLEVTGVRGVAGDDCRAAAAAGGALKPIAAARRTAAGIEAFVGPAWIPARSPLGALGGTLNGIALHGRYVSDLCFSGPGAGPDVTAATLLDDAIESLRTTVRPGQPAASACHEQRLPVTAPVTPWFARITFPGIVPTAAVTTDLLLQVGLTPQHVSDQLGRARYGRVAPVARGVLRAALQELEHRHRLHTAAYRCVD